MPRATPNALQEPFRNPNQDLRRCDAPGCMEEGEFRAPKSRVQLNDYFWFCLDHVRLYNLSWDYFKGLSEEEIEDIRRHDTVWQRPSWPLGGGYQAAEEKLRNAYYYAAGEDHQPPPPRRPQSEEEKALAAFELPATASFTEVKTVYKKLVKQLHPDANGGDKSAEERLKAINQAYQTLKKSFGQDGSR